MPVLPTLVDRYEWWIPTKQGSILRLVHLGQIDILKVWKEKYSVENPEYYADWLLNAQLHMALIKSPLEVGKKVVGSGTAYIAKGSRRVFTTNWFLMRRIFWEKVVVCM